MTKEPTPTKTRGAEEIDETRETGTVGERSSEVQYLAGREVSRIYYTDDTSEEVRVEYADGSGETVPADAPILEEMTIEDAPEAGVPIDAVTGEPVGDVATPQATVDGVTGDEIEGTGPTTTEHVTRKGDEDMQRELQESGREDEGRVEDESNR